MTSAVQRSLEANSTVGNSGRSHAGSFAVSEHVRPIFAAWRITDFVSCALIRLRRTTLRGVRSGSSA
jgi:hypothetical protein